MQPEISGTTLIKTLKLSW